MKFVETNLKGLYIIEPEPFQDSRGRFYRVYCKNELINISHTKNIVQINQSLTNVKGTVRGMHFQYPPKSEIKLVKCIKGSVFDVAIDLREGSQTFLEWFGVILSDENMKSIYIPEGFAHGFQTLEDHSELLYLHSEFYSSEHEGGIRFDDPNINIEWPIKISMVSNRDKQFKILNKSFKGFSV